MKRKVPEGGFAKDSLQHRMKRAKNISSIESKVELRRKAADDKENKQLNSKPKKSFKDFLYQSRKEEKSLNEESGDKLAPEIMMMKMELNKKKQSSAQKLDQSPARQTAPLDQGVPEHLLFPALNEEKDSEVIRDFSIKSYIKILCTQNLDWVHSVTFNHEDNMYKRELHEILDYYTYPATAIDARTDRGFETQLSRTSSAVNYTEMDKEWFIAFKDCYLKWLSFDDQKGKLSEFSLITKQYKVVFISKGEIVDGNLQRKRYAVVGNPSDKLVDILNAGKVNFVKYNKPVAPKNRRTKGDGTLIDTFGINQSDDESMDREPSPSQANYANTQDLFRMVNVQSQENDLVDINILKSVEPTTIMVEGKDIHALMNALMNQCKPYMKDVKLVASFSFTNSVHKTANISFNEKLCVTKPVDGDNKAPVQWFGIDLNGFYSFGTIKNLVNLFKRKLTKSLQSNDSDASESLKIT